MSRKEPQPKPACMEKPDPPPAPPHMGGLVEPADLARTFGSGPIVLNVTKKERQKGQVPEYIRDGLRHYKVRYGLIDDWGQCRYDRRQIVLNEDMNAEKPYTLMHEITHNHFRCGPYEMMVNQNEGAVQYISDYIIQLIRDNPELVRYLQETAE